MKIDASLNDKNNTDLSTSVEMDAFSSEVVKELQKRVKSIKTALCVIDKNMEKVAFNLYWIYVNGAYRAMGCESITDYALKEFDLCKSSTYSFINIVERFGARSEDNVILDAFDEKYKGYSSSKLSVMIDLSDDDIENLSISPSMSVRDIKKLVKQSVSVEEPAFINNSEKKAVSDNTAKENAQGEMIVDGSNISMPEPVYDHENEDDDNDDADDNEIIGYASDQVYEFSILDDERMIIKEIKAILKQNKTEHEEAFFNLILRYPVRKGEK